MIPTKLQILFIAAATQREQPNDRAPDPLVDRQSLPGAAGDAR
jgi:hypothetical protein